MQSSCSPQSLLISTKTSSIIILNDFSIINLSMAREHKGKVRWAAISREGDMALTCGQVDIVGIVDIVDRLALLALFSVLT